MARYAAVMANEPALTDPSMLDYERLSAEVIERMKIQTEFAPGLHGVRVLREAGAACRGG